MSKYSEFEVLGGKGKDERGKTTWPDSLRVEMDNTEAWRIVHNILCQLEDNELTDVAVSFPGKLDYDIEEEPNG